jgi:predicted O-methyltransferase YrrM
LGAEFGIKERGERRRRSLFVTTMTTFHDILQRYASAHCESGTDKTTSHSYGELYSELFAPIRTSAKRVLEIGVYSGASVAALADYFEGAEVEGIDLTTFAPPVKELVAAS